MEKNLYLILFICSFCAVGCRSTDSLLNDLRVNELTHERDNLLAYNEWFSDKQSRLQQGDVIFFVSTDIINRILDGVENIIIEVAQDPDIHISIDGVETNFRDGFPLLKLNGKATIPGWFGNATSLDLEISALLDTEPINLFAPDTKLKIKVLGIIPKVRYNFLQFRMPRFIEAIVSIEAVHYSEQLPEFTVPLEKTFELRLPSQDHWQKIKLPSKWSIFGHVKTPNLDRDLVSNIHQVLVLENGIYVFALVDSVEP